MRRARSNAIPARIAARRARAALCNELVQVIADCGRRFFRDGAAVARFDVDDRGRVWFVDEHTQRRIFTHRPRHARWRGFTHGGTLRALVEAMRDFIVRRREHVLGLHFGPWKAWQAEGDVWGYGAAAMAEVRAAAVRLGIVQRWPAPDATNPNNEPAAAGMEP